MYNPYVPFDWDGEFPDDFWDNIVSDDGKGWFVNYPDNNNNGFPDCMEGFVGPGIDLNKSWDHGGA